MRVEFFVAQVVATADTFVSQDYDVPLGLSLTPASCVSDYDLLSPYQQPASDVDQRHVSWIVVVRLRQRTVSPLTF